MTPCILKNILKTTSCGISDHGDKFGHVVHLENVTAPSRRRHQKVMEESPCEVISPELRKKMGEVAVKAAKAVNYENAGTIEFLLDKDKNFYFME